MANMKELKFRDLTKDDVEVRVQSCGISGNGNNYARLLIYKDARVDMNILDETLGAMNWQRRQYELKDTIYSEIGIYNELINDFIWKGDCGKESNAEKKKGESSDAFKRAGFCWGIGRELYTSPDIWVYGDVLSFKKSYNPQTKKEVYSCTNDFTVKNMKVIDKVITELTIEESKKGVVVFNYKATPKTVKKETTKTAAKFTKTPENKATTSTVDTKVKNALMELSKITKGKGIKDEVVIAKFGKNGTMLTLKYDEIVKAINYYKSLEK